VTYLYESLGPERFQEFCQALMVASFPDVQCLPVGQPDGGRDAYLIHRHSHRHDGAIHVFQVKFARTSADRNDVSEFVERVIKEEGPKVKRLIDQGAKAYYLLTNVQGTAHLHVGSIDRVHARLTEGLGLPSFCWWRDDLDRRLDLNPNIKWSYPDIIRGSDFLQALVEGALGEDGRRRDSAIRAYLTSQYAEDQEVKFKQVDLYNSLLDLFVDIPVAPTSTKGSSNLHVHGALLATFETTWSEYHGAGSEVVYVHSRESELTAALLLLNTPSVIGSRIVLEGAPGQGKSTITQYVCQVHRMRLLNKDNDLRRVPDLHKIVALRLPFRIDLRDFASWTGGKNPFAADANAELPRDYQPSLESFLAHQVSQLSGGHTFTVSDLAAVAKGSHLLIVLDGFDEVADVPSRERVVKEISRASSRLQAGSQALQIVVTSRPAAFANSPGFPEREWPHVSLQSMTLEHVQAYAEKWMHARQLSHKEKADFRSVLKEKLDQPHMRDLARNPMQLAILLNLIQTRGLSLPDKRTSLYDSYMELFFSREAEKSPIVREHRDLLVELHRYLAWTLQTEAEERKSRGSVTEDRLKSVLRDYLEREGHPTDLVDLLFTGMVERVVALVSRVQGTFEFEVQPLREYFAARHLYETAPYSPPGNERRGTKPERFEALARNFYWLNVVRFYCGCFSRGELASLADGLDELMKSHNFALITHPRHLAVMLLSDWVFTQQPITVRRVVSLILSKPGLWLLLASSQTGGGFNLALPDRCGRSEFIEGLKESYAAVSHPDRIAAIGVAMAQSLSPAERLTVWEALKPADSKTTKKWLMLGTSLNVYSQLSLVRSQELFAELGRPFIARLAQVNCFSVAEANNSMFETAVDLVLSGDIVPRVYVDATRVSTPTPLLHHLYHSLDFSTYQPSFSFDSNLPLRQSVRRSRGIPAVETGAHLRAHLAGDNLERCIRFLKIFDRVSEAPVNEWGSTIQPWSELIEAGQIEWGYVPALINLAVVCAGIKSKVETGRIGNGLFDSDVPICERTRYARLRSGQIRWWEKELVSVSNPVDRYLAILLCLSWATPRTILQLAEPISTIIDAISPYEWIKIFRSVERVLACTQQKAKIESNSLKNTDNLSPRLCAALSLRVENAGARHIFDRMLMNYSGADRSVLAMCTGTAMVEPVGDAAQWKAILPLIRHAYQNHVVSERPAWMRRHERAHMIPEEVAKEICRNAEKYPLSLIGVAESSLTSAVGSKVRPLGAIARTQDWFAA